MKPAEKPKPCKMPKLQAVAMASRVYVLGGKPSEVVEEVVVGEEVRDVFAKGVLRDLVGVGLLGRHLLRGEVRLVLRVYKQSTGERAALAVLTARVE